MWPSMSPLRVHEFVLPLPICLLPLRRPEQSCSSAIDPDRNKPAGDVMRSTFPKSVLPAPDQN